MILTVLIFRSGPIELFEAYAVWFAILFGLGVAMGSTAGEKLGWPLILGMFFTMPGLPITVGLLRLTGLSLRTLDAELFRLVFR